VTYYRAMSDVEEKKDVDRQYVWLIRYGLTEFSLVEGVGPYDSDIHPVEGVAHAQAVADKLCNSTPKPDAVYADPFLRCTHTGHIIASTVQAPLKIEEGLTEWQTPSLLVDPKGATTHPRTAEDHKKRFDTIDLTYSSLNPAEEGKAGAPNFEESVEDLKIRCSATLDKIFGAMDTPQNAAIVSHAPCNQMMALYLAGQDTNLVKPWSLGGVTCFSRSHDKDAQWTLEYFSDTDHMPGEYKEGVKGRWSLPDFQ